MDHNGRLEDIKTWQEHKGTVLDSINGYDVIECAVCRFKHIIPIPDAEQLKTVYEEEYYSVEKPLYFKRTKEDLEWWNLLYGDLFDSFEEHLPQDQRRILDVGSGPGYFLLFGRQRGWQTKGIEPSRQAAAHSRDLGLDIVENFLDAQVAETLGSFDVVYMHEVLEHIPHPQEMLSLAFNLLKPGGLLCVVVPNDYNPFQYALRTVCGHKPWWVAPPHHINYFDFDSLSQLFSESGFDVVMREATFPIDMFLLMGDNYVGNDKLGRECHAKRKLFELNIAKAGISHIKRNQYRALANIGIGREVILLGQKNETFLS